MEDENQLPLKRVELSLSKFNDVAIPHHLELLRQHKANIIKHEEAGQYAQVRREQAGAGRAAARLRSLLAELSALRGRVREPDRQAFDTRTQRSRDLTLQAIMDYLGLIERSCTGLAKPRSRPYESSPMSISRSDRSMTAVAGSAVSTDSVGVVAHARESAETSQSEIEDDCDVPVLQLQVDDHQELALAEREAALRGWTELQAELRALHGVWAATHAAARAQREQVLEAASHVEVAADNVEAAKAHLSTAEKLRAGAWGAGGACVGALVGGPVGLLVGAKAGAAALLAGSALGYVGARLLGHKRQEQLAIQGRPANEEPPQEKKAQ
ncbi:syntaxin-17 isoform X1 [Cydia fagiglandana]|uniref:syntaxin-17 isoform X1 n=1 Tax=Cydia fagiglandana TaxID=1458189 RepID=UPI002FEE1034